ncbi:MAG: VOC family protein [Pseudomonadota bacterium]
MALGKGGHVVDLAGIGGEAPTQPSRIDQIEPRLGVGHIAFQVEDKAAFDAAVAELKAKGVRILGMTDHASQESVYFTDPDANVLEIYWERPGARAMNRPGNPGGQFSRVMRRWPRAPATSSMRPRLALAEYRRWSREDACC